MVGGASLVARVFSAQVLSNTLHPAADLRRPVSRGHDLVKSIPLRHVLHAELNIENRVGCGGLRGSRCVFVVVVVVENGGGTFRLRAHSRYFFSGCTHMYSPLRSRCSVLMCFSSLGRYPERRGDPTYYVK